MNDQTRYKIEMYIRRKEMELDKLRQEIEELHLIMSSLNERVY